MAINIHMEDLFSHQNFVALSKEVQNLIKTQNWLQRHGKEWGMFFVRALIWIGAFLVFIQPGVFFKIFGLILLSYAYYGIGITGTHESSHLAFSESKKVNRLMCYFFSDFWCAQSSEWWYNRHVQVHHVFPNVPSVEKKQFYFPWLHKYLYFFVTPYLVLFWLILNSVLYLRKRPGAFVLYAGLALAGLVGHWYLFALFIGPYWAILAVFVMRSGFAPLFLHLSVFNHLGLENPKVRLPWLPHQTNTTRNLKTHWILTGMGGNALVDCHIEHHLFPALSNSILGKIRPIIMKYLKREGYNYHEETYWSCLKNCLKYYTELFSATHVDF